ncbi:MAG: hypothetical protein FK731_11850 [Asgard group archaeon]|nr:hypothetical protein [Asgard group archaeon]
MALKSLRGIKFGRLIVLLLLILIPLGFVFIIDILPFISDIEFLTWQQYYDKMPFLGITFCKILVYFCAPLFFSLPWVVFLYVDRNRIAETFDNMGRALRKVSIGLNIFYTVNAFFIMLCFILPFGSPLIGVFGALGYLPWLLKKKTKIPMPWFIAIIPGLILGIIPVFLAVGFYWNYVEIWGSLWGTWIGSAETGTLIQTEGIVHFLYGFGYSVAVGAVCAGFLAFIFEGATQVDRHTERPKGILYVMEFLVAIGVFIMYVLIPVDASYRSILFWVISGVALGLGILEFILRWFKKTKRSDSDNVPMGAYVVLPLFIGVEMIRNESIPAAWDVPFFREYALTIALILACVVYLIIFFLAYSFAGETYPSRWSKDKDIDDEEDIVSEESIDDEY